MGNQGQKCIIVSAGDMNTNVFEKISVEENDLIIACDGGYDNCLKYGIKPDILLGDFDSIQHELPENINRITLNCEKDDTDTMSAVKLALEKGFKSILITGALGGRIDHSLANLQTLLYIEQNSATGRIYGDREDIRLISNDTITIPSDKSKTLSIFTPDFKAEGVTIENAKYCVSDYTMENNFPIGVSNEFTDSDAIITVKKGRLFIILTNK